MQTPIKSPPSSATGSPENFVVPGITPSAGPRDTCPRPRVRLVRRSDLRSKNKQRIKNWLSSDCKRRGVDFVSFHFRFHCTGQTTKRCSPQVSTGRPETGTSRPVQSFTFSRVECTQKTLPLSHYPCVTSFGCTETFSGSRMSTQNSCSGSTLKRFDGQGTGECTRGRTEVQWTPCSRSGRWRGRVSSRGYNGHSHLTSTVNLTRLPTDLSTILQ